MSGPGADIFGSVTRDISKFEVISGWGITSSTHAGREEYWGPEASKEDWKLLRPVSIVKEGLASVLGQHTDLDKDQGFSQNALPVFGHF